MYRYVGRCWNKKTKKKDRTKRTKENVEQQDR